MAKTRVKAAVAFKGGNLKSFTSNVGCFQLVIVNYDNNSVSGLYRNSTVVHPLRNVPPLPVKVVLVFEDNECVAIYSNTAHVKLTFSESGRYLTSTKVYESDEDPLEKLWELWDCKFDNEHYYIPEIAEPLKAMNF